MRMTAKQRDADRRLAKKYAEDALKIAVYQWCKAHGPNKARAARAFDISTLRARDYYHEISDRERELSDPGFQSMIWPSIRRPAND